MAELDEAGEFGLIKMIKPMLHAPAYVIKGIGDDCAVLPYNETECQVITCDLLVEGVHFIRDKITPYQLGYKSVAVSLSDIAAMGGHPTNILISLGLPESLEVSDWQAFYCGVADICAKYRVNLIGGDTTSSRNDWVINVTAMGLVEKHDLRMRADGQKGDLVFVTGKLGASRAGLELVLHPVDHFGEQDTQYLLHKHHQPEPCCEEVAVLNCIFGERLHALNDISDGLVSECTEIAEASELGMILWSECIPLDEAAVRLGEFLGEDAGQWALTGGEDYQLVGTVAADGAAELAEHYRQATGKLLTFIGEMTAQRGIFLQHHKQLKKIEIKGFNHFQGDYD